MPRKTGQLQIRVTPAQKARLRQLARAAGQDVSTYVLGRVLPPPRARVRAALMELRDRPDSRFAFAELADTLRSLAPGELREAIPSEALDGLSAFAKNYVAAMVEQRCAARSIPIPDWVRDVAPLQDPWFATPLPGLRLHLLRASPVPFKRRNLFIDTGAEGLV